MAQVAKTWLRVLAPMLVSVGGLLMLRLLGPDFIDQRYIADLLSPLGKAAPLAYIAFLAVRPLTLLPGQLLTAVGGMMFGTLAATLYSLTGSFLSAMLLFVLARKLGTRPMKRLAGGKYPALVRAAKRHDFLFAFMACINPLCPTDVMLVAAAASGARFWPSVAGVMLGTIPGTFLTAQFGSGLAQGRTVMTAVSAAGLVVSLVLGVFIGRRFYKELTEESETTSPESDARDETTVPGLGGSTTMPRTPPKSDGVPATW
ncbi:TVP38/TMEM64 family protein [Myxococcus llanfairpwllgwyngyllgogerychwyrndrobwllllantysiliogogogochensis]|uniref:TVP38/TMEM64 family membrane protein n=1 Tax=Myxococcus llanfairpwllgwyngyllgogerychwyrndrobwllllantysiliogogogochensis TaxID=2590453 RepID=A0A540WK21_9BACT|nr:VTT domain-containing protein [Myxococcus llanfairpwllgwyngyllgogerychwyrndrobwllllantysiliogogogochensis]TQF09365.1 TVP38/TMEM64 family protein [Myxococcus llanfairpwllgwyngyllgogerychwyrndrobwllllantysiliogogogochensis]